METFLKNAADSPIVRWLTPMFIVLGVIAVYWQPLHLDLWNDEVYSLLRFQKVPLLQTLTDYHETNNHIFSNFLLNVYLRTIGNPSVLQIFQHPETVRLIPLLFTLTTYLVLYLWMLRMLGYWTAVFACVLLTATIPYYNFALQYRSYSLLIMLATICGYIFWQYLQSGGTKRLWSLAICTALIFYSHPAGIYLAIAFSVASAASFSGSFTKAAIQRQRSLYASCVMFIGAAMGALAYLPVMEQLLNNPWVKGHKISTLQFLRDKLLSCSHQLISARYWLLIPAAIGVIFLFRSTRAPKPGASPYLQWILFCLLVYLITFLIPLLRHDDAPQRTFTMLIPFVVAGLTIATNAFGRAIQGGAYRRVMLVVLCLALAIEMPFRVAARNHRADELTARGEENASMLNGYYLHHFAPMRIANRSRELSATTGLNVYFATNYRQEMPHYLEALRIPLRELRTEEQFRQAPDSFYVVTMFPDVFRKSNANGSLLAREIPMPPSFYGLFFVRKLPRSAAPL